MGPALYGLRVQITLNGESHEVDPGTTIAVLLDALQLRQLRFAIEINQEIVRRDQYPVRELKTGDRVEVISFVGGG